MSVRKNHNRVLYTTASLSLDRTSVLPNPIRQQAVDRGQLVRPRSGIGHANKCRGATLPVVLRYRPQRWQHRVFSDGWAGFLAADTRAVGERAGI